jgi:hypothetical protein
MDLRMNKRKKRGSDAARRGEDVYATALSVVMGRNTSRMGFTLSSLRSHECRHTRSGIEKDLADLLYFYRKPALINKQGTKAMDKRKGNCLKIYNIRNK